MSYQTHERTKISKETNMIIHRNGNLISIYVLITGVKQTGKRVQKETLCESL